jgi:hypothetical protein
MRAKTVLHSVIAIGIALWTGGCTFGDRDHVYRGPGCLIHLYTLANLQGPAVPVVRDTPELAEAWRAVKSVKVIYGTWRLFTERDYKGFMGDYAAPADVPLLMPADHLGSLQCIKPQPESRPLGY